VEEATLKPSRLRALFRPNDDPYAGADIGLARRFAAVVWGFGALVVVVLNIFYPPTKSLGDAGWALAAVGYLSTIAIMWVLIARRRTVTFNFLYVTGFVAVLLLAATQYGAGGRVAPYHELYMFQLIGAALMHTPRRVLVFLAVIAAAMFAPAAYAPAGAGLGEITTELFMWTGLSLVLVVLMRTIRSQRLALKHDGEQARQLARVDSLTGLGNRRAFDEALDSELARSRRSGTSLSLLVADLDGFKEINDRHGHPRGDECLRQAADALRATVRRPDRCFRWGGDEFAILLEGADAESAAALAFRVEKAVARSCSRPGGGSLTLTCGHAALDAEMSAGEAVERADEALLALKSGGRTATSHPRPPAGRGGRSADELGDIEQILDVGLEAR
jgi:diguanylate cyclase (GGDEF)-like protein